MLLNIGDWCRRNEGGSDVVVVGSGAVGLTLSVALARSRRRVLVLEAGPAFVSSQSQSFFETAISKGRFLKGLHSGRFRALGGTTNFWGGQLTPIDPIIFLERPWVASIGWPFQSSELDRYYRKVFDLLGMKTVLLEDSEVWRSTGVEIPIASNDVHPFLTRWAPQPNFIRLFNHLWRPSSQLSIVTDAPVVGFFSGRSVHSIGALAVRTPAGEIIEVKANTIVLANGTIEAVRLLQLPFWNGTPTPWSSNPWIGRTFIDHIDCTVGNVINIDKNRFDQSFAGIVLKGIKYQPKLKLSDKAQIEGGLVSIAGHFNIKSSYSDHLKNAKILTKGLYGNQFNSYLGRNLMSALKSVRVIIPMIVHYLASNRIYNPADRGIDFRVTCEQKPLADSRITLIDRKDSLGVPIAMLDWRIDGSEIETIAAFAEMVRNYLRANRLADLRIDPRVSARDPCFLGSAEDAYHHMGGARMALSRANGVVDISLKVHGAENLYVAGAAVFPTSGFANPTLTAMALGQRLAAELGRTPG